MKIRYLFDENLANEYRIQLLARQPDLEVLKVGDENAPPYGTKDPEILCWCEENDYILVTNNRRSMPVHLADHLSEGRHVPGIFVFRRNASMGLILDSLAILASASLEGDHVDQITFIPL
ncbi:DUF5615 family PIN-like protein [Leptolyngbya sp. AN03gr2]|uniref:DUF5615 family PIN-like protein n=1 Tax=unclassified Leptolyngbya TaxID=2650499 RepID=UPI003D31543A